jgi:hypothetical protein
MGRPVTDACAQNQRLTPTSAPAQGPLSETEKPSRSELTWKSSAFLKYCV